MDPVQEAIIRNNDAQTTFYAGLTATTPTTEARRDRVADAEIRALSQRSARKTTVVNAEAEHVRAQAARLRQVNPVWGGLTFLLYVLALLALVATFYFAVHQWQGDGTSIGDLIAVHTQPAVVQTARPIFGAAVQTPQPTQIPTPVASNLQVQEVSTTKINAVIPGRMMSTEDWNKAVEERPSARCAATTNRAAMLVGAHNDVIHDIKFFFGAHELFGIFTPSKKIGAAAHGPDTIEGYVAIQEPGTNLVVPLEPGQAQWMSQGQVALYHCKK